jgi:glycosyltransferase involved in cell wall biosynthesis
MRVLHICPYMHPTAGGPPVVVEKLSLLTPSEGWDASIITTSLYCDDDGRKLQKSLSQRLDVQVLPISGPSILKHAKGASAAIDRAVKTADVVHIHTLWHPLNTIARQSCQRYSRRYALMPHGMLAPYSLSQRSWAKKIYLAFAERKNLQDASRLIFTTSQEQIDAHRSLPWLAAGDIVPLGADCPSDIDRDACIKVFRDLYPEISNRRCLLFLGRIHQKKGLERLLNLLADVIRVHPHVLLIVAGTGDPHYVEYIKHLVGSKGLERNVLFTGMIEGRAKYGALACAELFVLPSKQENFAIAVAEAMHMAVPVIISKKVDSWPLVQAANAGFVIEEKQIESGFKRRIVELLNAPEQARHFGKCGQKFAREQLTWQRVSRDMARLYQVLLSE